MRNTGVLVGVTLLGLALTAGCGGGGPYLMKERAPVPSCAEQASNPQRVAMGGITMAIHRRAGWNVVSGDTSTGTVRGRVCRPRERCFEYDFTADRQGLLQVAPAPNEVVPDEWGPIVDRWLDTLLRDYSSYSCQSAQTLEGYLEQYGI